MRLGPRFSKDFFLNWQRLIEPFLITLCTAFMLWLCLRSGIQHDFIAYISQWNRLLSGTHAWAKTNTYGPIHTIIGFLLPLGTLVPKTFIVGSMLVANAFLVHELIRERGITKIQVVYLLAIPSNMLFIGVGIIYGLNDAFVAALLVFAVILRRRGNFITVGALIGIAALTKYYPLLLLPFFALDKKRVNWSILISGIVVFIIGFVGALAIWGLGPINAVLFNTVRGPKLLSVFAALTTIFGEGGVIGFLLQYNSIIVVIGVAVSLIFVWMKKLNWMEGVVFGYLVVLTLYKVGHQQFYLPFLFMLACLPLFKKRSSDFMARILLPIALLLSLYQFGYQFASDGYHAQLGWVRAYGGLISFSFNVAAMVVYIIYSLRHPQISKNVG